MPERENSNLILPDNTDSVIGMVPRECEQNGISEIDLKNWLR